MSVPGHPGFAELIAPLTPEAFLGEVHGRAARHFPGDAGRFDGLFSFPEANRLLGMWRLWNANTFKVVLDGRDLPAEQFCVPGHGRDGNRAMLVDARRLEPLLARGATVVLDAAESLSPGVRAVSEALGSALGGSVICNVYCSFEAHAGFPSHYDTTDVFALHVAGVKRWRVYEGRADAPLDRPGHGYASQPPEHHERAKGRVLEEVAMTPGDVLYLPRGQYHDAIAASGASLHLSFGVTRATALDFVGLLQQSLADDALLRRELPHFDDVPAIAAALRAIGARLAALTDDDALARQVAAWQRERVFRDLPPAMELPGRAARTRVRIRRGAGVTFDGATLAVAGVPVTLDEAERAAVAHLLRRELFLASDLVGECGLDEGAARALLDRLAAAGAIEPV